MALAPDAVWARIEARPEATAVQLGAAPVVTYDRLGSWARHIAGELISRGVGDGAPVAVLLPQCAASPAAALAAWWLGCPYVPLDPEYPAQRLVTMLADCDAAAVVVDADSAALLPDAYAGRGVLVGAQPPAGDSPADLPPRRPLWPEDVAYLVYTSGSTGRPKAVMVGHGALANLVDWHLSAYQMRAKDRCGLLASPAFDAAIWETWPALASGATLCVAAPEARWDPLGLQRWLLEEQITVTFVPTTLAAAALDLQWPPATPLRTLLVGGDLLPRAPRHALPFRVVNHYGLAECAVVSTAGDVECGERPAVPSIGRPIAGCGVFVMGPDGTSVADGESGELWVEGVSLAHGYFGRPRETAERFVPHPTDAGRRAYRTGDWGHRTPDERLVIAGRQDNQVKIRGQRIELGEVEAALAAHPLVAAGCVVAVTDRRGQRRLVAYYVPSGLGLREADLWNHLSGVLSAAMVPAEYIAVPALPTTPNGKLDRARLTDSAAQYADGTPQPNPEQPTAERSGNFTDVVRAVFANVLGVAVTSDESNFFRLGGDSLLAVALSEELAARTGRTLELRTVFDRPTVAEIAHELSGAGAAESAPVADDADAGDVRDLTAAERGVWFQSKMAGGLAAYNVGFAYRVAGEVDADRLQAAADILATRHQALTTVYEGDVEPHAVHRPDLRPLVEVRDVPAHGWQLAAGEAARTPFATADGPLLRILALRDSGSTVLVLIAHHLVCDGMSLRLLLADLAAAYAEPDADATPRRPFSAYARAQAAWSAEQGATRIDATAQRLVGAHGDVVLPNSHRQRVRAPSGGRHDFAIAPALQTVLREVGADAGASLFTTLFAGFAALLRRYGTTGDIVIGMPHARREDPAFRETIGLFVHILGVRLPAAADQGFTALLRTVRDAVLTAAADSGVAFEDATSRMRQMSGSAPTIRVVCTQQQSTPLPALAGMAVTDLGPLDRGAAEYDLVFSVVEHADGTFGGAFEYADSVMSAADAERMAGHLVRLLELAAADPKKPLRDLSLMDVKEAAQLIRTGTGQPAGSPELVHGAILAAAIASPDAVAVADAAEMLTYLQLEQRSAALAGALHNCGVRPGDRVALLLPRCTDVAVAMLGVLRLGAAYVPIDPGYPPDRIAMILAECGARAVVSHGAATAGDVPVVNPEDTRGHTGAPAVSVDADDIAYVLYTSGSTGRPKGAMITHRALANYTRWFVEEFDVHPEDRVLASTTPSFDAFGIEIFPALFTGARIVMAPPGTDLDPRALMELAAEAGCTILATVPALLRLWVEQPELAACKDVRHIFCGGETLAADLVERVVAVLTVPVTNLYGPSEATIDVTYRTCRPGDPSLPTVAVPIGRPLCGVRLSVHLPDGGLAPIGVPGELFAAGVPVSLGYFGRPRETAARFVPEPSGEPGSRSYATGDIVVWLDSTELWFLGREDGQVKLNGYRIELEEIAAVARTCAGVAAAAAAVAPSRDGLKAQLVLTVVPVGEHDPAELSERVLATARAALPRQMVPQRVAVADKLPLLPNGKLDVQSLTRAETVAPAPEEDSADEMADWLRNVFREVLTTEDVGYDDSFFKWGGDSISAIQVAARASAAGLEISVADVLALETVRNLAEFLTEAGSASPPPTPPRAAVPFTPVQRWFLDRGQSVDTAEQYCLLAADPTVPAADIERALTDLVAAHDALRLVWRRTGDGFAQHIEDGYAVTLVEHVVPAEGCDPRGVPSDAYLRLLLAHRPAAAAAVRAYRLSAPSGAFMMPAIHHRAVDAVSWHFLLDELRGRLAGEPPSRAGSFAAVAAAMEQAAAEGAFAADRTFWVEQLRDVPAPMTEDARRPSRYAVRRVRVAMASLAGQRPEEVLLQAVLTAAGRQAQCGLLLDLEGHGRDLSVHPDIASAVGWFTALYPVALPAGIDAAAAVERVRTAKAHGSAYGVLRYLDPDPLPPVRVGEMSLNYLGRGAPATARPAPWTPVGAPVRACGEDDLSAGRLVEIDAIVVDDSLVIDLSVRAAPARAATIAVDLANAFEAALPGWVTATEGTS